MEEKKKTKSEIECRLNACHQELAAYDYSARKVIWELARTFRELFPDVDLPMFDKYEAIEQTADERRAEIRELEKERKLAKDERI